MLDQIPVVCIKQCETEDLMLGGMHVVGIKQIWDFVRPYVRSNPSGWYQVFETEDLMPDQIPVLGIEQWETEDLTLDQIPVVGIKDVRLKTIC
jgi:hypothetical protein